MTLVALLALADSRLPAGGHAHSAAAEQFVTDGLVRDEASLATLLRRRLLTGGAVAAGLAATACADPGAGPLAALDDGADARTPSPAARTASRAQGRALLRVASSAWPSPVWTALRPATPGAHHAVVLGVATAVVGGRPRDAALLAAYLTTTAPATAAQRLLGLDPVTVAAVLASLGTLQEQIADAAALAAAAGEGPASGADPLTDLLHTRHTPRQDKLFAS